MICLMWGDGLTHTHTHTHDLVPCGFHYMIVRRGKSAPPRAQRDDLLQNLKSSEITRLEVERKKQTNKQTDKISSCVIIFETFSQLLY